MSREWLAGSGFESQYAPVSGAVFTASSGVQRR